MKDLKVGKIYKSSISGGIAIFRGYQGDAFIFTSLNRRAKEVWINYLSKSDLYPLRNPHNWGKITSCDLEPLPFFPALYWKLKLLLTWKS
jgi:hypothetical protein